MMRIPLVIIMSFFAFLQLLVVLAHARTLSSGEMFTHTSNLKMPTSLDQPSSPAEKKMTCGQGSSLCRKFVSFTQYQKPAASPPPPPGSPSGGKQSPRPSSSSPAERLCSSPCLAEGLRIRFKRNYHEKRPSSRKDSHPCSEEEKSLCDKFWKTRDSKRPSLSPPPKIPTPSLSLASS